jgi:hypothetical protein
VLRTDDEEQAMGKVAPSVIAREQLQQLLAGSIDRERNIVSALVEAVTRLVVQELVEVEQGVFLGGRGRYERREDGQVGSRNGYEPGRIRTAEGSFDVAVPQVRGTVTPFRSSLMSFLDGNSDVLPEALLGGKGEIFGTRVGYRLPEGRAARQTAQTRASLDYGSVREGLFSVGGSWFLSIRRWCESASRRRSSGCSC